MKKKKKQKKLPPSSLFLISQSIIKNGPIHIDSTTYLNFIEVEH